MALPCSFQATKSWFPVFHTDGMRNFLYWSLWKLLKHMAVKGCRICQADIISLTGLTAQPGSSLSKKTKSRKQQCLPNLHSQLLVQDKYLHNYCVFEYNMMKPTFVSRKFHSHQTLGLPLHRIQLDLGLEKKAGTN